MAQFSLCCILVLFCFYFAQYPIQIENIVSNAAHPHVERSNIKLVFLPPNTTSVNEIAIDEVESASSLAKKVNLFDAIMWLRSAWVRCYQQVTTIKKCFAVSAEQVPAPMKTTIRRRWRQRQPKQYYSLFWMVCLKVCQA